MLKLSTLHRIWKRYPCKWICLVLLVWTIFLLRYCGLFTCLFTKDYFTEFTYPLEGDITGYVRQMRNGIVPDVLPINSYDYPFLFYNKTKCTDRSGKKHEKIHLLILIKSAVPHRGNRGAIRRTWGRERDGIDLRIRLAFLVGVTGPSSKYQELLEQEYKKYGDIIQSEFVDVYFNNTIKMMQGIRWVMENCHTAEYILFSDDDMYVSIKNLLKFVRNPGAYPLESTNFNRSANDGVFFAGSVFLVSPVRTQFSKWYISVEEYPYSHYPPFVNAGSFVLSYEALVQLFYGSMYTKHLRFDDVFLGLVARKMNIHPVHSPHFYNWKKGYSPQAYENVIAVHGYDDPFLLTKIWNEQESLGHA